MNSKWKLIYDAAPIWIKIIQNTGAELIINAQPSKIGGEKTKIYALVIKNDNRLSIFEQNIGLLLPKFCIERHINFDGSFCIGFSVGNKVSNIDDAISWWDALKDFIINQESAVLSGCWPPGKWLSHGKAAISQLKAEKYANKLGISKEYQDALNYNIGWLASQLPKIDTTTKQLYNGRAACIQGCSYKNNKPILRRSCKYRIDFFKLIYFETERRNIEKQFVIKLKKKGFSCCKTMINCALSKIDQ